MRKAIVVGAMLAGAAALGFAAGQDTPPAMEVPKPGPEHELLKKYEGEWTSAASFAGMGESKGTQSSRLSLNGFWLIFDYKSREFDGHGCIGYDVVKKKYVATWIDSWMPMLLVGEGDADKDGRITFHFQGVDLKSKKPTKEKWTLEMKDADTQLMSFFKLDEESGRWKPLGTITYARRK